MKFKINLKTLTLATLGVHCCISLPARAQAPDAGKAALAQAAPEKFALQVGINNYQNDIPKLTGAVEDVKDMREVLVHKFGFPSDHIVTLTDGEATRDAILSAFRKQ